jgi:hypothetical protein
MGSSYQLLASVRNLTLHPAFSALVTFVSRTPQGRRNPDCEAATAVPRPRAPEWLKWGHEGSPPSPRRSAGCGFSKQTLAEACRNDENAPIPAIHRTAIEPQGSTQGWPSMIAQADGQVGLEADIRAGGGCSAASLASEQSERDLTSTARFSQAASRAV